MGRHTSDFLYFEDTTYGSFTGLQRVPDAGFRWEQAAPPRASGILTDPDAPPLDLSRFAIPGEEPAFDPDAPPRDVSLTTWLVENEPANTVPWGTIRAPMSHRNVGRLAADFARCTTPGDYLAFANKHGRLGHERREPLALWARESRKVRMLTTLMRWVAKRDEANLGRVVQWTKGSNTPVIWPGAALDYLAEQAPGRSAPPGPGDADSLEITIENGGAVVPPNTPWLWRMPARRIVEPDVLRDSEGRRRWAFGDVVGPARFYVCDELNRAIRGHVTTKLMPFVAADLFRVYVEPDCLLSAISVQLQIIVARGRVGFESKPCEADGCMNHFTPKGNTRYCSTPCARWGRRRRNARYRAAKL